MIAQAQPTAPPETATEATPRERIAIPPKFQSRFDKCNRNMAFVGTDMRCGYCGADLLANLDALVGATIDHIVPVSLGGTNQQTNLVACCYACNQLKRDLPARTIHEGRLMVETMREFYGVVLEALRAEYR